MLLGIQFDYFNFRLQDYHFLWSSIPTCSSNCPNRLTIVPLPLIKLSLGSSQFARRYYGNRFLLSFPLGTKMFQFPRFALSYLCIQ